MPRPGDILTIEQVAAYWRCDRAEVWRLIVRGLLPFDVREGDIRVRAEDVGVWQLT